MGNEMYWLSRCMSEFVVIFDNRLSEERTRQYERLFWAWNWPFSQPKHFINQIKTKIYIFFINGSYVLEKDFHSCFVK